MGTYVVTEDAGPATIAVVRTGGTAGQFTVEFSTSDGTAATADYQTVKITLTFASGVTSQIVDVPITTEALDEANETVNLSLAAPSTGAALGVPSTAILTILDDDPTPTLSIDDVQLVEGDAGTQDLSFTVSLSAISGRDITVQFDTTNGSAIAPDDFTAQVAQILSIPAGTPSGKIVVPIAGDLLNESDETFTVTLSGPMNALIADGQGTGTIVDNDPIPTLSIADESFTEGDAGTSDLDFTVNLSAVSGRDITVQFSTANGSAVAPGDFTAQTLALLIIPAGSPSGTISIPIVGDTTDEFDESFTLSLTAPTNATILDGLAIGTILDDDPLPTISIDDPSIAEGDVGFSLLTFTITLSTISGKDVTVLATTADDTAQAAADYTAIPIATPVLVSIPAGTLTGVVTVPIVGEAAEELDETFFVNLFGAVNGLIADGQGQGTIINDDTQLDLIVDAFVTAVVGATDQLEIRYQIVGNAAPQVEFAFFASADARFDAADAERRPRLLLTDPTQLTVGPHTVRFSGIPYRSILNALDNPFVVTRGQVIDAAGVALAESDTTNNDLNFVGLFHEPGTPLLIRGKDDTDRYLDNPDDVIAITGGATLRIEADFLAAPISVPVASITEVRILGLGGADSIVAGPAVAVRLLVRGGPGDDILTGGSAADSLNGDDGNDILAGGLGNDVLDGGPGTDTADFSVDPHGVVASLVTGRAKGQGRDILGAIENLIGSPGRDRLTGNAAANMILGGAGADLIFAGAGADIVAGGDGNDSIFGEAGADALDGDAGNDSICGGTAGDAITGGDGNDHLEGGDGDDDLRGNAGNDFICGDAGNDVLAGNAGNDSLIGEQGIDQLLGGADFDSILFDALDLPVDLGGGGRDGGKAVRFR
jgi:Ca2+-binding RTX toxin-like protein